MHAIADTETLVADGVITPAQATEIEARAREAMVSLAINAVLCFGIIAATMGFIFWLADPVAVAVLGVGLLGLGSLILTRASATYGMFGNAAVLIGAGMLIGGAGVELLSKHEDIAGAVMAITGLPVLLGAAALLRRPHTAGGFVLGAILLMGGAFHVVGLGIVLEQHAQTGLIKALYFLYMAGLIAVAGGLVNVRAVTALAIVPFAQMLDTGTWYFHAAYVFYSPEPTLSILQMSLLIAVLLWAATRWPERLSRHARVLMVMGFIVANLCALVGSLWGDVVGETLWGPGRYSRGLYDNWDAYRDAREAFRASATRISADVYSVLWAVALAGVIGWSAFRAQRGLFNAGMTFAAIHAYTQFFESFADEPLAYVVGGLASIPLAWGMWRMNNWLKEQG